MATWTPRPVLAGIDGSPDSLAVAHVAAIDAQRRGLPLRLILFHAHPSDPRPPVLPSPASAEWWPCDPAGRIVEQAVQRIRDSCPELSVVSDTPGSDFVDALVKQSQDAALLVVPAQRLGGYDSLLGRWLSDRAVTHAHCPVLVARGDPDADRAGVTPRPVLIGIDGSEHCVAAMPFAVEEALLRGAPLWAVSVYCVGPRPAVGVDDDVGYCASTAQAQAAELIARALAGWTDRHPRLDVIRQPMYAPEVASALVGASTAADLVVVGCRGRSAITSLRLGSVSRALVQHAHCPVLVGHACGDHRTATELPVVDRAERSRTPVK
jgi:nucleotide-binding universal stress UspA family protein